MSTFRERLLAQTATVPTGGVRRLLRSGRLSASLARSMARGDMSAAELEAVVASLGELKGLAMKAGQMLSYLDPTLPEEMRAALSVLQRAAPATLIEQVKAAITAALAASSPLSSAPSVLAEVLQTVEPLPLAVASIGQVHRATLANGTAVVVKVRHPGIALALKNELGVARAGASVANVVFGGVSEHVAEVTAALLDECDYSLEAERQARMRSLFATDDDIVIPEVLAAAPDVLVSRFVGGQSLEELGRAGGPVADRIGAALFRFHLGGLYRHGLFHADPHPGNYAVDDEGRLVVYDFGCVRSYDSDTVQGLVDLADAVRKDDVSEMGAALVRLGGEAKDDVALRRLLRGFYGPFVSPGTHTIPEDTGIDARQMMKDKQAMFRLRIPGRLLFLFRLRFGLFAVLARLGARADWSALEQGFGAARSDRITVGAA